MEVFQQQETQEEDNCEGDLDGGPPKEQITESGSHLHQALSSTL